jgi:predicted dehydrogenase
MVTIGVAGFGAKELDYVPTSGDGWKLVRLAAKKRKVTTHALSDARLDAVALFDPNREKARLAEKALLSKKHVLIDFPATDVVEKARKLQAIASERNLCLDSPNLLRTEPGFQELKRMIAGSSNKMFSLTVGCGVGVRDMSHEFSMKLAQLLDLMEWLSSSKIKDVSGERSTKHAPTAALVALISYDNEVKGMLNMYSAPTVEHVRLWVDVVFEDSVVHVDPYAQSVRIAPFRGKSSDVNWATESLVTAIEIFVAHINGEPKPLDLQNLERMLNIARVLIGG